MTGRWADRPHRAGFNPAVRRTILQRDGHRCTHPLPDGTRCPNTTNLEADHIIGITQAQHLGWTNDQIHHETNGVTLCATHHRNKTQAQAAAGRAAARTRKPRLRPRRPHPGLNPTTTPRRSP